MSETPRQLAQTIVKGGAWTNEDVIRVAQAYLEVIAAAGFPDLCRVRELEAALLEIAAGPRDFVATAPDGQPSIVVGDDGEGYAACLRIAHDALAQKATAGSDWEGVYAQFCRDPDLCRGRGSCPRDPSCSE